MAELSPIKNPANKNKGKPLNIRRYYINLPIMHRAFVTLIALANVFSMARYAIVMYHPLVEYLIIPWTRVGYEMVNSQRSPQGRVRVGYNQSHIQQARME